MFHVKHLYVFFDLYALYPYAKITLDIRQL